MMNTNTKEISNGVNGKEKALFGGALTCFLPDSAQDVSVIREIPDNQEVFCHETTDQSIIIDILEYQAHVSGENAARYHFEDIALSNDAEKEKEITLIETIPKDMISLVESHEAWFLSGRQMVSKFNEHSEAKNLVQVHMVLYRLPQHQTDLLVVLNSPIAISVGSSSSMASSSPNCAGAWRVETFKQIACSLKLIDVNLFVTDDG